MIKFYGYNDGRAIAAYNKRNLTIFSYLAFFVCVIISIIAVLIPFYELFYVWVAYLVVLLICIFAMSFSKIDNKTLKEKEIKTKHLFVIDNFKLYRDGTEIKNSNDINFYVYKKYIFLQLKKSYYIIPNNEMPIDRKHFINKIREVQFGTSIEKIMAEIKEFVNQGELNGTFEFESEKIIWILGKHKFTYYIDLHEIYVSHDKLRFNKFYMDYTHYHIDFNNVKEQMKEINNKWGK